MSNAELNNEKLYQTTMLMARKMLLDGIISKKDLHGLQSQRNMLFVHTMKDLFLQTRDKLFLQMKASKSP